MLQEGAQPVHYPANPDVFQFDEEVSRIFPDMARRAIPMYHEAHRAHIGMLESFFRSDYREVLDVGASRGAFFQHLKEQLPDRISNARLRLTAVDNSEAMVNYLMQEHPDARVYLDDISTACPRGDYPNWRTNTYDVVVLYYVLQFIRPEQQVAALARVLKRVKPGGYLVFGHKATLGGPLGELAQAEYINFRVRNGYSVEEIQAKTQALKGSMFQLSNDAVIGMVREGGFVVQETTRWMAFSSFIAQKV